MSGTNIQLRYHLPNVLSVRISIEIVPNVGLKFEMFFVNILAIIFTYSSKISDWLNIDGNQETQKPYIDICIMIKNQ